MFEDEIELIRNWLEVRGFEIFIDVWQSIKNTTK
jgi:hypothetical protein